MRRETERNTALERLMAVIRHMVEQGEIVPCLNEARSHLWISEDKASQQVPCVHPVPYVCPSSPRTSRRLGWSHQRQGRGRMTTEVHCPRCNATADECLRIGERWPYRLCCKKCNHVPRTNQPKEKAA